MFIDKKRDEKNAAVVTMTMNLFMSSCLCESVNLN